ncbi:MAG: hypothetical protein IPK17_18265 [Chloroflexi bacterium]|uniref:hypothetical protein n=1 Tax=Candidatus Flexifilum breve TaxID=3140694 RepID=UPI003135D973|nr:hypothetical protein [Chloroflexota bacterium]
MWKSAKKARSFHHSGKGSYASGTLTLYAGVYRLEYQFPEAAPVALKLIDLDSAGTGAAHQVGSGSQAFRVETNGRFGLNIDPTDNVRPWEVSFRQM